MVSISNGATFAAPKKWSTGFASGWSTTAHIRTTGDMNGDGKADVVGFGNDGVYVALSNGTAFAAATKWIGGFAINSGNWLLNEHPRAVLDMNGDKKADVVGFGRIGVHVALSTGAKLTDGAVWSREYGSDSGKWTVAHQARLLGDITGDGKPDLVGLASDGVVRAISTGATFGPPAASWPYYELAVCK
jgi:hypothetical protein